jgi:hypothetical protein
MMGPMRSSLGALAVVLVVAAPATALEVIGTLPEAGWGTITVDGDRACATEVFSGVSLLDVSDPTAPVLLSRVDATPNNGFAIVRACDFLGDHLYFADPFFSGGTTHAGLFVADVSDPEDPVLVGEWAGPQLTGIGHVEVEGGYLYTTLATLFPDTVRLQVFDLSDPVNPVPAHPQLAALPGVLGPRGLRVLGNRAYLGHDDGLVIYDVSTPTAPVLLGSATGFPAWRVDVVGDRAYTGECVVDVSVPSAPALLGCFDEPLDLGKGASDGAVTFYDTNTGFAALDVTDPAAIRRLGRLVEPACAVRVRVVGDVAYCVGTAGGFATVDVSDPQRPALLARLTGPGFSAAGNVEVLGPRAYLVDQIAGLQILDVADPSSPTLLGTAPFSSAAGLAVRDGIAFVGALEDGVRVVDVSNPAAPSVITTVDTPGGAVDVQWVGAHVFVADAIGGLRILDASDPSDPFEISALAGIDAVRRVEVVDGFAYVLSNVSGTQDRFWVVDVSDPANPDPRGSLVRPFGMLDLHVHGQQVYVGGSGGVFDVSDPDAPVRIGNLGAGGLDRAGSLIWMARPNPSPSRLVALDARDPAAVRDLAAFDFGDEVQDLVLADGLLWLTHFDGLRVVDPALPSTGFTACSNGIDDDGDLAVDHPLDFGCQGPADDSETPDCGNGIDDDGDGLSDASDAGCLNAFFPREDPECDDGWDDDGDGLIDAADPQCTHPTLNEAPQPPCGLGGELAVLVLAWGRRRRA